MKRNWRICSILFSVLFMARFADPECTEASYLEVGREGMISCGLEPFYAVSWYTKEDYDEELNPFIYFNGGKDGSLDEYDVHPNGSLIIRTVSLNHARSYIVTVLEDLSSPLIVREVHVEVYVMPNPSYPVVNGHTYQQHVYMDVNRGGELNCSMRDVYPRVSLSWTVVDPGQSGKIQFQHEVPGTIQHEDNLFDVSLSSSYEVTDHSTQRITIECGVSKEMGDVFLAKTTVDLLLPPLYPVVNGHVSQKHVYLDVERKGHLTCVKEDVDARTTLTWKLVDPSMQDKISFQSSAVVSNNNDGTRNINQTFDYELHDHSLERITIKCEIMKPDADELPITTMVDLLFQNEYPMVNGHVNQNHVYLDVEREGHLTCVKENVDAGTRLFWALDPAMQGKVTFQSTSVISINDDGTVNINQTFVYAVHDNSLERITVECKLMEPDSDEHPYKTTVDLIFPSDDEYNKSSQGTPVGISLSTMVLVIAVLLIVSILYYCNGRRYKKSEIKYMDLLRCRQSERGYDIPVGTIEQNQQTSMRESSVIYNVQDSAVRRPQDIIEQVFPWRLRETSFTYDGEECDVSLTQDSENGRSNFTDSGNFCSYVRGQDRCKATEKDIIEQVIPWRLRETSFTYDGEECDVSLTQDSENGRSNFTDSGTDLEYM